MKYNVLVADDNREIQTYFAEYKDWAKHEMNLSGIASTGLETVEHFRKNKVDLAMIDLKLKGINGLEVIAEIQRLELKPYVIVMGGYKSKKYIERAKALGANDVLYKNIDEKALNGALLKGYCYLEGHNEKRSGIPCKALSLMEMIEGREVELNEGAKKSYEALEKVAVEEETPLKEILQAFWTEFWAVARKRYNWMDNIFNFYRWENFSWETVSENNRESEFLYQATRFGKIVRGFDICGEDSRVREICAEVIREVENGVSLSSVAKELNYSKNHICTLFKQKSGESFIDYVNRIKIERAKERLENSVLKNYEVGKMVGFENTDYFMRVFKQIVGMTPGEYRIFARKNERNRTLDPK